MSSSALRVAATGCMWVMTLTGCADNSTLLGSFIANESSGADLGSDPELPTIMARSAFWTISKVGRNCYVLLYRLQGGCLLLLINHCADFVAIVHDVVFRLKTYDRCCTNVAKRATVRTRCR